MPLNVAPYAEASLDGMAAARSSDVTASGVAGAAASVSSADAEKVVEMSTAWRALASMTGINVEDTFDPVCFLENHETDTQVR